MDLQLKGKRALVTGASSGLGEAIARMLASEGAEVIVHGRHAQRAEQVADAIRQEGGHAVVALGDLSTDDGADHVTNAVLQGGAIESVALLSVWTGEQCAACKRGLFMKF